MGGGDGVTTAVPHAPLPKQPTPCRPACWPACWPACLPACLPAAGAAALLPAASPVAEASHLVLAADVPHREPHVLVLHALHIEAWEDGGAGSNGVGGWVGR